MATPLVDALRRYLDKQRVSYHTPGHKGQAPLLNPLLLPEMDLTELVDTGSLYDGGDAIEEAERCAATVFGASQTLFSGGGCTLCMQTMLALAAGRGRKVLMGRNAHRSAVNAAVLLDLDVRFLLTTDAAAVEQALEADPDIRSVYVTSPDYYGRLCDIAALSAVCRRHDAALLVDNAHGSHLGAFGLHPLSLGADATADSAHKTLPVLTGGAYLHIAADGVFSDVPRERLKALMSLFGSTSPSFAVLASLDAAQHWWEREGQAAFAALEHRMAPLKATLSRHHLLPSFERVDPVRLTIDTADRDATVLVERLRDHGVEAEYADSRYAVLLLSPFHTDAQLADLQTAIDRAVETALPAAKPTLFSAGMPDTLPVRRMSLRDASFAPLETIPCREAVGRISAQTISVCPPGVAAIAAGEEFSASLCRRLLDNGHTVVRVVIK